MLVFGGIRGVLVRFLEGLPQPFSKMICGSNLHDVPAVNLEGCTCLLSSTLAVADLCLFCREISDCSAHLRTSTFLQSTHLRKFRGENQMGAVFVMALSVCFMQR